MRPEILIPVVIVIIYILNTLIRGSEEERQNRRRAAQTGDRGPSNKSIRRTPTDIERFLEEVNRRRQAGERKPAEPARPQPMAKPAVVSASAARPKPVGKAAPRRSQPSATRPPRTPAERTPAREVLSVAAAEVVLATPSDTPPSFRTLDGDAPTQIAPQIQQAVPNPAIVQVRSLLAAPSSLQTALILQEILGVPLSRRHRRLQR